MKPYASFNAVSLWQKPKWSQIIIVTVSLRVLSRDALTLIGKSWKTHPEIFLKF